MLIASGIGGAAIRTSGFATPAGLFKMSNAIFLRWELLKNLYDVHRIPSARAVPI